MRKLTELSPAPVNGGPDGVRKGTGITFDCPKGGPGCECGGMVYIPFQIPLDGGAKLELERIAWERTGNSFETLTLHPSIHTHYPKLADSHWHGWIRDGGVITV